MPNKPNLTVMVFKDNDTSRSFQVSLGWITRLGLTVGMLAVAALLGSFFALKYYRVARKTDPSHVFDLEQQISDLRGLNKSLETKLATLPAPQIVAGTQSPMPIPTVTVTVTPVAAVAAPVVNNLTPGSLPLFSALPRSTQDVSANAAKLPITVSTAHTSRSGSGRTFKVAFDIQYVGANHGSQQGRIIVLARGANALFSYPEGVISRAGSESLIAPQQGEYFSVSRFREVKAEFPEVRGKIQDVEILIMSLEGQLMFYQKLQASESVEPPKPTPAKTTRAEATPPAPSPQAKTTSTPAPAKSPAIKPTADPSELIEPGVDQ